jgi:hypothetical protein
MSTHGATGTQGPIPIRRRLVRVGGNPLARSRGEVAIFLAEQGFTLVPCHWPLETLESGDSPVCSCSMSPRRSRLDHRGEARRKKIGKHPYLDLCPGWKSDSTAEPEQIREWLKVEPNLNWGLVTGLPHIVVFDGRECELFPVVIDADSTQATNQVQADIYMPKTLDVFTGRGLHIYHWTEVPMKGSNRLLSVPNVDVKGAGGYVMAPGSLHYSGAIYTACGRLEDISMASDDLLDHLVPADETTTKRKGKRQRITAKRRDNVIPLDDKLPKLGDDDLPPGLVRLLEQEPDEGTRSEPEFKAIRNLLKFTDDDELIAGTVRSWPVGERLHEHPLQFTYDEIRRAREYPDTYAAHVARQQRLVEEQWIASRLLPTMTRKVLHGFGQISIKRGGGTIAAAVREVAIEAGVEANTVVRHRDKLLKEGWLKYAHQAEPGDGYASTYVLLIPPDAKAVISDTPPTGMGGVSRMSPFGAESRRRRILWRVHSAAYSKHTPSGQKSPFREPLVDLSADSTRWNATTTVWAWLPYVTEEITPKALATAAGVSERHVRRITQRLYDLGLTSDRRHIQLVPNWREVWESLPEKMGTAGKKEAARKRLADERLARKRLRLVREGKAMIMQGYVVTDDGEII